MSSLHLVFTAPTAGTALADGLRAALPGDAVLLLQDGVYAAMAGAGCAPLLAAVQTRGIALHALRADLDARGLVAALLATAINPIDDDGFVALTEQHVRVVSWS